jgi:hypothetical protein
MPLDFKLTHYLKMRQVDALCRTCYVVRMGLADRKADEIEKRDEREELNSRLRLRSALISDTAAPNMWDVLVATIEQEVKRFADRVPKAHSLQSDLENPNNLTIRTTVIPLHTLVILRTAVGVRATLAPFPSHSLKGGGRKINLSPIFFSTNADLKPCFSDGDSEISLDMAVDHLLEPLFDLF